MRAPTRKELLAAIAVHPLPEPFGTHLCAINKSITAMRTAAADLGVARKFTPDGRFIGDLGEVLAKLTFGLNLHRTQKEGEDATCEISGKCVELKLRSKSDLVWVKKRPDFLIALYLCPQSLRWGVVCNGPGEALLQNAVWDERHRRFVTNLFKLRAAQLALPADAPSIALRTRP